MAFLITVLLEWWYGQKVWSYVPPPPAPHAASSLSPSREELGRGGTATVTKGVLNGREVAVKTCESVEIAEREAEVLQVVRHPNVVRFYKRDAAELYFELLGQSVRDLDVRDPATALRLMKDASKAVAHVHSLGLVHGDITPPNVLADEKVQRGVLIDWFTTVREGSPRLGMTCGWTAPEAAPGRPVRTDEDIYGLGLTFAFLARHIVMPWNARLGLLMTNMVRETPPRPSAQEVVQELSEIIASGSPCPRCGYWTPEDIPWCPDNGRE